MGETEFGVVNFVVLGVFLAVSMAIGIYYGMRQTDAQQLLITREMSVLPVSLSVMATFLSAILIVGTPSEIFYFGLAWYVVALVFPCMGIAISIIFLPTFYRLHLTSVYEYLGMRYGTQFMSVVGVLAFMTQNILYTGIALYAPSIVLSNVTGIPSWLAICLVGVVGTCYTAFGGFQAVIWADVLQAVIMVVGVLAILIQGCINVGGFDEVFRISRENGRLDMFIWNVDPLERNNFWNTFCGSTVMWMSLMGVNQPAVQRYLSLPTMKKAILTTVLGGPLIFGMITLSVLSGLAIFATYASCDPLRAGITHKRDELVPHFMTQHLGHVPGLPGLFTACVLSGALSTISSSLNSLATVTWEDFIRDRSCAASLSDTAKRWILRAISALYGVVSVVLAFVAQNMGGVLQVATGVYGGCTGPILGVFILALFVPFSNPTGVTTGLVTGLAITLWASFGGAFVGSGAPPPLLPTRVDGCEFNVTLPDLEPTGPTGGEMTFLQQFYGISYMLYSLMGMLITLTVGLVVSIVTGCGRSTAADPELLSPAVRCGGQKNSYRLSHASGQPNQAFQMEQTKQTVPN